MRVCVVSGSFLVSVFSSLFVFMPFFLIRESLLYFITTGTDINESGNAGMKDETRGTRMNGGVSEKRWK